MIFKANDLSLEKKLKKKLLPWNNLYPSLKNEEIQYISDVKNDIWIKILLN